MLVYRASKDESHRPPGPNRALIAELRQQGITDGRVLRAMERIPRDRFVPDELTASAWANVALAIPHGQTISQPFVVALMTQALALKPTDRVLEIGTGSGYQAAILSALVHEVITIERIPELAATAIVRLQSLGIDNVRSMVGDGSRGWAAGAPYDAIMVTAGTPQAPEALIEQLSQDDGRMVIPLGPAGDERLTLFRKNHGTLTSHDLGGVRFVPLIRGRTGEDHS